MDGSSSQPRSDPAMSPINAFLVEEFKHGNARRQTGFWCEVLQYIKSKTKQYGRRTYDMETGDGDEDYVQRAMIHYEIETGLPFKLRHCWEILKYRPKCPFNTKSGEASINLNTNVGDNEEDDVQEIRRPRGRDKARAAGKNNAQEKEQREKFLEIKRREVECREREIATQEYRQEQEDVRFYLQPYDHLTRDQRKAVDEIRAKIKAKYNLLY
ncbi:hypothetical protein Tco_0706211 [Tanacetum coccineum]|uniref:No apical meristem-associated C-terminal domain-containing protein n=1 Tax=Tanacetum coccineum TaxID=301880 RepID=A0ABQ4Y7M6_9ASTR